MHWTDCRIKLLCIVMYDDTFEAVSLYRKIQGKKQQPRLRFAKHWTDCRIKLLHIVMYDDIFKQLFI